MNANFVLNEAKIIDKRKILFITARSKYVTDGILAEGYKVLKPFRGRCLFARIIREFCFRSHLFESKWYTRLDVENEVNYIIVQDTLITKNYLRWLLKRNPTKTIIFMYRNLIGKAKNLYPRDIPANIAVWTYDGNDAQKYNLNLLHSGGFSKIYIGKKEKIQYDIFYVGADKGRGEYLLELESKFKTLGLKTKFIITKDGMLSTNKGYYSERISYSKVIEYDNKSRAILNIVLPNQKGATMRDYESIFNEVKLITNNQHIINYDFYKKENVFILGVDNLDILKNFIYSPFKKLEKNILQRHGFDEMVYEMVFKI